MNMQSRYLVAGMLLMAASLAGAQSAASTGKLLDPKNDRRAGEWIQTAVDLRKQVDTVRPAIREQRNRYWRASLEPAYESIKAGGNYITSPGGFYRIGPELPEVKNGAWVLTTFSSFHSFAISLDYKMIYTEANFTVDTVISRPETGRLQKGTVFDVGLPGGVLIKPDGERTSFLRDQDSSIFQLNHKYLMLVRENTKAAGEYSIDKRWDITSGYVMPDTPEDKSLAAEGRSVIAGISVSAALDYLRKVLPDVVEDQ